MEKNKYIESISIDNVHMFLNDFVFTKHFLIFVTANDFGFWFFTYFLENKNICLNILFIFYCLFLLVLFGDQFSGVLLTSFFALKLL